VRGEYDFISAEDGSKVTACTYGEGMDTSDKSTNKAMSAALKYAIIQAFSIPTEELLDSEKDHIEPTAKRPETKPAPPSESAPQGVDSPTILFVPSNVTKKDGETKGRAWTMYTIHDGGQRYSTFDKKFAEDAKQAMADNKQVFCIFRETSKGNNIELLKLADEREPGSDG
jgi:hypothetical protein